MALFAATVAAWEDDGPDEALRLIWKRVAYATRYGRAGLGDALKLDCGALQGYLDAVGELVTEEAEQVRRKH